MMGRERRKKRMKSKERDRQGEQLGDEIFAMIDFLAYRREKWRDGKFYF